MCFSAKASFIAAGTLSIIGLLSVRKASSTKKLLPFAVTPFLFGAQQATEGIVWMTINYGLIPSTIHTISMYTFIFFAGAWWPTWSPFALYQLETDSTRKKFLLITLLFGIFTTTIYIISLFTQNISVVVKNHHLYYPTLSYPFSSTNNIIGQWIEHAITVLYIIPTVTPFFLSRIRGMWSTGIVMGLAALTSQIVYPNAIASTWCFFAAIASVLVYVIIIFYKKSH